MTEEYYDGSESDPPRSKAIKESLSIPQKVRDEVDARDGLHCRVCGKYLGDERAHHHIVYGGDDQGMGGRRHHDPNLVVTICWMWGGNCHDLVHGNKRIWQPLLLEVVKHKGITAFQLRRWQANEERRRKRNDK